MDWKSTFTILNTFIAIAAFFRPEVARRFRYWQNQVDIFPLKKLEVGFSTFGPTLGLVASVRGSPNTQFIRAIVINLIRKRDNLTHKFEWAVFRSTMLSNDPKDMQVASGFSLGGGDAKTLNIQFWDNDTKSLIEEPLERLKQAWFDFLQKNGVDLTKASGPEILKLYQEDFKAEQPTLQSGIWGEINRFFYWEPGDYQIDIAVSTWDPEKVFKKTWSFSLSKGEAENLRNNTISTMFTACNIPQAFFNFANPVLK